MRLIRLFDIYFSLLAVIVFSPILLLTSLFLIFETGFPVLFFQTRIGKNCKKFKIIKFRSMYFDRNRNLGENLANNSSNQNNETIYLTTQKNDERITSVGKIIRKFSIDELPQLFNVLIGDMSIVGPRPDTPVQIKNYNLIDWEKRHLIRPGITGLAQINGRSSLNFDQRLSYDLELVKTISLRVYFDVILRTFSSVFNFNSIN